MAAVALTVAGCRQEAPPPAPAPPPTTPATPATPTPPEVVRAPAAASPTDAVKAFLTDYLGDVQVTTKSGTPLPAARPTRPRESYRCSWPAGTHPAGTGTIEVDKERGFVTLAILRWTGAKKAEVTNAQLRSIALERLQRWVGAGVEDSQVTPAPLHSKTRVAFLWDGRAGDHYSGRRAHVVLSVDNGLPVSFDQYRPPDTSVAPKLNAEQGQKAALAALSPFPKDFHQTGIEARLYDHSPLAKDDGPVWAVALNGTKGKDNQRVQAGAVIDAVSGQVLAPKPKAKGK